MGCPEKRLPRIAGNRDGALQWQPNLAFAPVWAEHNEKYGKVNMLQRNKLA